MRNIPRVENPPKLQYAPPSQQDYPWWHDLMWGVLVAFAFLLIAGGYLAWSSRHGS